jgi:putative membrane protein
MRRAGEREDRVDWISSNDGRRTHRAVPAAVVAVLLLAAACAAHAQVPAASAPASAASAAAGLSKADLDFVRDAAQAGHAEVEGSRLAIEKAVNTVVRGYAQQMVDDHGKALQELAALAAAKGVAMPTEPSVAQKARIGMLSAGDGSSFDRRYASTLGVAAHQDAIRLFEKAAAEATDPDVRAYAQRTLPTLVHHLEMAQDLNDVAKKEGNVKSPSDRKQ